MSSLLLAGCATNPDPVALIPSTVQASVVTEDRMLGPEGGSGAVSVDDMLAAARGAPVEGGTAPAGPPAAAQAAEAVGSAPAPAAEGAGRSTQQTAAAMVAGLPATRQSEGAPATTGSVSAAATGKRFEVTFDGADDQPSPAQAAALSKAVKAARLPAKTGVTLIAGPGGGATPFDQALLANKRARAVKSLLPADWTSTQVYDPAGEPDTVSIVVGARN
ncbi:hypothetical protein J5J86_07620 [Aquabacter sp. L1I39]|uniref:hypothetical protein n=1 Tax=Aquabacter sp. L1I39 TaxID=2820278 RepID=UPI001AD9F7E5|nr:hypothetical protein [Aquabacter sp. L1I39]QTL05152.1 hypothetical protein J5J86_07620 [Aquabacter sp. L1I39]